MIAPAVRPKHDPAETFTKHFLPEITRRSYAHFSRLDPAAREEAVQDCVCEAWVNFQSAVARGKRTLTDAQRFIPALKLCLDSHIPFFTSDDLPHYADALLVV